jgi:signal transduction histidine kinase
MDVSFFKAFNEKFGVRVFAIFTIFVFVVSFSFTALFIHHESKSLTNALVNNGKLLAKILANGSRIGVFSENEKLLKDPVYAILQQEGVIEVAVFSLKGELLKRLEKPGIRSLEKSMRSDGISRDEIFRRLRNSRSPLYLEGKDKFGFWSPVFSGSGYSVEESLFFEEAMSQRKDHIMGFVGITVDKGPLNKRLNALLFENILIGILFLLIGSGITYIVVRRVTRPLNKLTQGVNILGRGGIGEKVPVETGDEIGKLAKAFNTMSESLKKREEALRDSEKRLQFLSSQLLKAQEKERMRLSKELHDELGQALAILKHRVRSIQRKSLEGQSSVREECGDTIQYIDQIIENVRRLSRDLSPSVLEDLGLSAALRWLVENFVKQHPIQTSLEIANIDHLFSQEAQTNLYRIFQEAFTNIGKHARANNISFAVEKNEDHVSFFVEDDGEGFDMNQAKARNFDARGMGLATMEERARMLGAALNIESQPGEGTRIVLMIPIEKGGMG